MAFTHGSKGYLMVATTDISQYVESSDLNLTRESADIKPYSVAFVQRVMGIISAALNAACAYDPALDALIWAALISATATAWKFGPQGGTSGLVRYSGDMWISSSAISAPSTGKATHNFVCQPTGTITKDTFSA
jgi:hypothetical protein